MTDATGSGWRSRYLTSGWNNTLVVALGAPIVVWAVVALSTSALSDRAAFIGMVLLGAVY